MQFKLLQKERKKKKKTQKKPSLIVFLPARNTRQNGMAHSFGKDLFMLNIQTASESPLQKSKVLVIKM